MLETILFAAAGGLILNLVNLLEIPNLSEERRPDLSDCLYWLHFLVWPACAIVLVLAYEKSGFELKPLLALNIGLSAPLIIRSMIGSIPFKN